MANAGVIFDMDGVLVASGPAHLASWRILARRHGIEISDEHFGRLFGRPSRDIIRIVWGGESAEHPLSPMPPVRQNAREAPEAEPQSGERSARTRPPRSTRSDVALTEEQIRRIDDEKEAVYRELITGLVPLTIGARELVAMLSREGLALAVATSGPPENVELVLREGKIARFFAATVNGFDVIRGKPAPDCFLLAAERIGLPSTQCVVVEDAPVGIAAARAAGMPSIGLTGTHPADTLRDAGATRVVESLADITPRMINELLSA